MPGLAEKDIQDWCQSIIKKFHPHSVLYEGEWGVQISAFLSATGIKVRTISDWLESASSVDDAESALISDGGIVEVLALDQLAAQKLLGFSKDVFTRRFGNPSKIVIILSPDTIGPSLIEITQALWQLGFAICYEDAFWTEHRNFSIPYEYKESGPNDALVNTIADWWRMVQTAHTQRMLTAEYHDELVEKTIHDQTVIQTLRAAIDTLQQQNDGLLQQNAVYWEEIQRLISVVKQFEKHQQEQIAALLRLEQDLAGLKEKSQQLEQYEHRWKTFRASRTGKLLFFLKKLY